MASILSAGTTTATSMLHTADTSGVLQLASNNGTIAVTIDTSQNVGIGAAPSTWSGYNALELTNGASSGSIAKWGGGLNFGMANNAYYTNASGWLYKSTNNTALYQQETAGVHMWYSAPSGTAGTAITWTPILQAVKDKTIALQGASSYSGTGISFPATQSASSNPNTLDDYEEGTWTPVWSGSSSGSGSPGGSAGSYVKIGTLVMVTVEMNNAIPFITFSGTLFCSLPFTCGGASGGDQFLGPPMYYYTGGNWNTGSVTAGITPTTSTGNSYMNFTYMLTNGDRQSQVTSSSCSLSSSNNTYARFCITYITS